MAPVVRAAIGFGVGFLAASAVVTATNLAVDARTEAGPTEEVVGEPDFFEYCSAVVGERVSAVQTDNDAFGWRCVSVRNGVPGFESIDFDVACQLRFGDEARAQTDNPDSAYSWRCLVPVGG